ncbi:MULTISPECIES: YodC family protein [Duffyella]|jgi:uncharacterized protein YodC (DUF2158 family)|uniref:DUF2158 domain-containing protein n=1 Tax=Duffyella gerundensis TaxID=1619313 RepID=A0A0U5L528_9GAMM|nr:hypothetical protein [Duffyella gerundensis]QTO55448.1 DUF2158 domain-containing protein [Duffyella gerundensis]CUU24488.1 hypothetical protein EM595_2255 [Duffyella gerundensis]
MYLAIGDEVRKEENGPLMIVTGYASGMVECCWHDGYALQREAFRKDELVLAAAMPTSLAS